MNGLFMESDDVNLKLKVRMLKCYVFPVLLHGAEAGTLTDAMLKEREAFELWCYRTILRIIGRDRITNDIELTRMKKDRGIKTIKTRKLSYFAHEESRKIQLTIHTTGDAVKHSRKKRLRKTKNILSKNL